MNQGTPPPLQGYSASGAIGIVILILGFLLAVIAFTSSNGNPPQQNVELFAIAIELLGLGLIINGKK